MYSNINTSMYVSDSSHFFTGASIILFGRFPSELYANFFDEESLCWNKKIGRYWTICGCLTSAMIKFRFARLKSHNPATLRRNSRKFVNYLWLHLFVCVMEIAINYVRISDIIAKYNIIFIRYIIYSYWIQWSILLQNKSSFLYCITDGQKNSIAPDYCNKSLHLHYQMYHFKADRFSA